MKYFILASLIFLCACNLDQTSGIKDKILIDHKVLVSGEHLVFSGILVDKYDFGKPTASGITINPEIANIYIPQAWSREVDMKEYWYYNWEAAQLEASIRKKRLPTSDEWKTLLSHGTAGFDDECVGFRQGGSNIWSIVEKGGKSYWSSTEYIFDFDRENKGYANIASIHDDKDKCDMVGFFVRHEKWQGFSVRGIPLE